MKGAGLNTANIAPGCFGIPSIYSFGSVTCANCPHTTGCQKESLRCLEEDFPKKTTAIVRLIDRHKRFQESLNAGHTRDEALEAINVHVERKRASKPLFALSEEQKRTVESQPEAIGAALTRFWQSGLAYDGKTNPFPNRGFRSLRIAFDVLKNHGSVSRKSLKEVLMQNSYTDSAAKTEVSRICRIFEILDIGTFQGMVMRYNTPETTGHDVDIKTETVNEEPEMKMNENDNKEGSVNHALAVKSDHSLGESIMQVDSLVERAKVLGYESVALVDTMSVSGLARFTEQMKKAGLKSVVGCTLRVYDDPKYRKPKRTSGEVEKPNPSFNLKVYVKGEKGIRSLLKLLSKGNTPEYFYYHSRVGMDDVMEMEDVVVSTGDIGNIFHHQNHVELVRRLQSKFDTFIEFVPVNTPLFDTLNRKAMKTARVLNFPANRLVASYPFLYETPDGADTLDVLRGISKNIKLGDPTLNVPYVRDWAFDKPECIVTRMSEMAKRIGMSDELMQNALKGISALPSLCHYEFVKQEPCLPKMADDEYAELVRKCREGWVKRLSAPVLGYQPPKEEWGKYKERLAYELGVLKSLGFSNYFLLVNNIVEWAKSNGISVGPGRGSVGGSLVAYLLGITEVDPIRFDLLFERFINPSRTDLPDADLDFASMKRQEVVQYITDHFGEENVAGISNYVALGPSSAIRDVSRISGLSPFDYNCSKQVEKEHGVSLSLEESAEAVPDIAKFKSHYPVIWKHATRLEGCMKNFGQHAAGVIVAGEPISNRAVVITREGGRPLVSWDKKVVEDWGLVKMDILGLTTLDVIDLAQSYIEEEHGKKINLLDIPLNDEKVMEAFGRGDTVGVFQFESGIMRSLLKNLSKNSPLTFDDLTAATALNRPGPLEAGLVDEYVAVKQGNALPHYPHPSLENCLKGTLGVLTYQEQIMQACQALAGFSPVDADHVRRAMGKKDIEKMAGYKVQFVEGAKKSGMSEFEAASLWDKVEGFAGYAFNKSHATEYSVISYWMMWLKVHYPQEFFAAAMSVVEDEDKIGNLVIDARKFGINLLPPDINVSSSKIEIRGNDLYMPFQAITGISHNVAGQIMRVRREMGGKVTSYKDFEDKIVELGMAAKVNKSHRDKLNRVGAFASVEAGQTPSTHPSRAKDRIELMPGFTTEVVKADRTINNEKLAKIKLVEIVQESRKCQNCSLAGCSHPMPRMGTKPVFMVVFDSPTWQEGQAGRILEGDNAQYMKAGLKDSGLDFSGGYFTSLVRSPKQKGAKSLTNEQINGCSDFLKREIEILKPPVIVAMGSAAIRYLLPNISGASSELVGKVVYRADIDASVICGINPMSILFDSGKVRQLQSVFSTLKELVM